VYICAQNSKPLASAIPEIQRGSENLKVGHVTSPPTPYDLHLHSFRYGLQASICVQNFTSLALSILEIRGGPKI